MKVGDCDLAAGGEMDRSGGRDARLKEGPASAIGDETVLLAVFLALFDDLVLSTLGRGEDDDEVVAVAFTATLDDDAAVLEDINVPGDEVCLRPQNENRRPVGF